MYPPSEDQFNNFIGQSYDFSLVLEYWSKDKLVMVALCDELNDGLSAIYTFFEPDAEFKGLGVYAILSQISLCKQLGMPFLYLGFWIENCAKMNYKSQYRPYQLYLDHHWTSMD